MGCLPHAFANIAIPLSRICKVVSARCKTHLKGLDMRFEIEPPNNSRGRVKSAGVKFVNDQFLGIGNFDEMSWRIQWSEIEFSHSLSPEPPPIALSVPRSRLTLTDRAARLTSITNRGRDHHGYSCHARRHVAHFLPTLLLAVCGGVCSHRRSVVYIDDKEK